MRAALFALTLGACAACATADEIPVKAASALETVKDMARSANELHKIACGDAREAFKAALVQSGVVEPDAVDAACAKADEGLDAGYEAIDQLVDVYAALNGDAQ